MRYFIALGASVLVAAACGGVSYVGQGKDHLDGGPGTGGASTGGKDGSGGASGAAAGGKSGRGSGGRAGGPSSGGLPNTGNVPNAGNAPNAGAPNGGASGGGCKTAKECAVPAICKQCADGSSACAQAACVNGACQTTFPPCPADAGLGTQCKIDLDCPQLGIACKVCPDGSEACPFSKCVSGSCVSGFPQCPPADGLKWFATCGAPVCRDPAVPTGAPLCDPAIGETVGSPCTPEGRTCDPGGGCSGNLLCTTKDPRSPGGCPISRAKYKQEIEYLSQDDRAKLADDLQSIPLVRYRYKDGPEREHLGFIIEDIEPSPSVDSQHDQVDLYGYASMAVAALQQQHAEIEALKREVRSLKAALGRGSRSSK